MSLIAIYNPVCGDGTAKSFFYEEVLPLLQTHGRIVDNLVPTDHPRHAGMILADFMEPIDTDVTVVLGSGDGTLHEIINFLLNTEFKLRRSTTLPRIVFALVPCGTANALYSSFFPPTDGTGGIDVANSLRSVESYIYTSRTVPLTLANVTLSPPPDARPQVVVSAVVVSTSLHASILYDSESLRKEIPGIERFKVAAQNNSTKWYNSSVKLFPISCNGVVQVYDPVTKGFVNHPESNQDDSTVSLHGPFIYFLSTVNVDRLEPAFRITPLARTMPPPEASCEVVVLRPLRDPTILRDNQESRAAFVPKLWAVLGGAYREGSHINLRYDRNGEIVSEGDWPAVVEYIRCGGWEWAPDELDEDAHLLCSDGDIIRIEKKGMAVCSIATPTRDVRFAVYA